MLSLLLSAPLPYKIHVGPIVAHFVCHLLNPLTGPDVEPYGCDMLVKYGTIDSIHNQPTNQPTDNRHQAQTTNTTQQTTRKQTNKQTNKQKKTQRNKQNKATKKQTNKQTNKQTKKQRSGRMKRRGDSSHSRGK